MAAPLVILATISTAVRAIRLLIPAIKKLRVIILKLVREVGVFAASGIALDHAKELLGFTTTIDFSEDAKKFLQELCKLKEQELVIGGTERKTLADANRDIEIVSSKGQKNMTLEEAAAPLGKNKKVADYLSQSPFAKKDDSSEGLAEIAVQNFEEGMNNTIKSVTDALAKGNYDNIGDLFADGLAQTGKNFLQQLNEKAVNGLTGYLQDFIGGKPLTQQSVGGMSNDLGSMFGMMISNAIFAKGGIFDKGKIKAFAKGGVVNSPTTFPIGLMGEAGPEAIMPLKRLSSGKLGVSAESSAPAKQAPTIINNYHIDARGAVPGVAAQIRAILREEEPRLIDKAAKAGADRVAYLASRGGAYAKIIGKR